jgi:hypothetical protein
MEPETKRERKSKKKKESKINLIKVENMSYEEQMGIKKVLLTEAGEESVSEFESDKEDGTEPSQSRKEADMIGEYRKRSDKIFKYIRMQDKNVQVPDLPPQDQHKLTVFMELDDVLLHTFICDQNFGYLGNPAVKDPDHEFFLEEIRQPVLVYIRDHCQDFMDYLKTNQDSLDVIVYTSAMQ